MGFISFIKMYYEITGLNFTISNINGNGSYKYKSVWNKKSRIESIVLSYILNIIFLILIGMLLIYDCFNFGIICAIFLIILYLVEMRINEFGIFYYLVCWIYYNSSSKNFKELFFRYNSKSDNFILKDDKDTFVIKRYKSRSVLKFKMIIYRKKEFNKKIMYVVKRNKIVLKHMKNKIIIFINKGISIEEIEKELLVNSRKILV